MNSRSITIFTDGASRGNPGPGGWAAVIIADNNVIELGGAEKHTTNNRMELQAAIGGIKKIPEHSTATLFTDSSYLINGITKWINSWKRSGWKTKTNEDVLNKDLWIELSNALAGKTVHWKYVGGHAGVLGNERCDHIATAFADGREVKLYYGPIAAYDLPDILNISYDEAKASSKKNDSARARAKAYSYVSSVNGVIEVHPTWAECEKRVKGVKGARYKKSISAEDEAYIINEFGSF